MPSAHAKLSPSASFRWGECGGSVWAEPAAPDAGSDASDQGTACHHVAEVCLKLGAEPESFVGEVIKAEEKQKPVLFVAEMAAWVREGVDWVRGYLAEHPQAVLYTETEVDIGLVFGLPVDPETGKTALWGTADFIILSPEEMVVGDFKFGYRYVSVETSQLMLYALGFLHLHAELSFGQVRKVIIQPRTEESVRESVVPVEQLAGQLEEWRPKVERALDPFAPRVPGEKQCSFCKAAPVCPALHERTQRLAQEEFAMPENLPMSEVAKVLAEADLIRAHLKAIEQFAARMLSTGQPVPGFKLVRAKCNRAWGDVAKAQEILLQYGIGPDKYLSTPEMCSPAQAEKLLGKKGKDVLAPCVVQPLGGPKLAPESDPRLSVTGDFDEWKEDAA